MLEVSTTVVEEVIRVEVGRLRGYLERLWSLTKSEKLDRRECLNIINDIDRSLSTILFTFASQFVKELVSLPPQKYTIYDAASHTLTGKSLKDAIFERLISTAQALYPSTLLSLKYMLENPQFYKDDDVRRNVVEFCKELNSKLIALEDIFRLKWGLQLVSELISRYPSFTENWAVATVYLSAMEIAVKRALMVRGMEVKEFRENVRRLINALRSEGVEVKGLEELLPSAFWEIRNRVVHEGYSPSSEELKIIVEYVKKFMEKIEHIAQS